MMKKLGVIQSNFLPWKGYFDIINDVDIFIFHEDVQYTKRDWRNRNKIKCPNGIDWITVPVLGGEEQLIYEAKIDNSTNWDKKILKKINAYYKRSEYFSDYYDKLSKILNKKWDTLSELNIELIKWVCNELNIKTKLINSLDLKVDGKKSEKLVNFCKEVGADYYLSGPAAKAYIELDKFESADIKLAYKEYNYPEYTQLWGKFEHYVSVIDMLFNLGKNTPKYIWSGK